MSRSDCDACDETNAEREEKFKQIAAKDKEIERLKSLIDLTAHNFLQLQPGIAWEGGIDNAMKAACEEIKRLQEQLARWQQTAISERARRIEAGLKLANIDGESWDDRMARARVLAAKELGLEQDASYIGRLETAYLLAKEESLWANHDVDDIVNSKQRAQAALAKIREGK